MDAPTRTIPVPPHRTRISLWDIPGVPGEPVVVADPDPGSDRVDYRYGMRLWSPVYEAEVAPGRYAKVVEVVTDEDWWKHRLLGALPPVERVQAARVWIA